MVIWSIVGVSNVYYCVFVLNFWSVICLPLGGNETNQNGGIYGSNGGGRQTIYPVPERYSDLEGERTNLYIFHGKKKHKSPDSCSSVRKSSKP